MGISFYIFFLGLMAGGAVTYRDYCLVQKTSCGGNPHIGCNNTGKSSCYPYQALTFTKAEQEMILNAHNRIRHNVSSGFTVLPQAMDMYLLTWNDELASLAALNVLSCKMVHDKCRNTDQFCGQNLLSYSSTGQSARALNRTKVIISSVNTWHKQIRSLNHTEVGNYQGKGSVKEFTQLIWSRTRQVGCAGAFMNNTNHGRPTGITLIACNYKPGGNILGEPIYTAGGPPGSDCSSCSAKFPTLCV